MGKLFPNAYWQFVGILESPMVRLIHRINGRITYYPANYVSIYRGFLCVGNDNLAGPQVHDIRYLFSNPWIDCFKLDWQPDLDYVHVGLYSGILGNNQTWEVEIQNWTGPYNP
jgi:hypothetical protein